jgi:putative oxidoreductase
MRYVSLAGRIFFALIFIAAAPRHFSHEGIQHAADLGVPWAGLLAPVSGAMALMGGLGVALGYRTRWAAWVLVAFLIPVTIMMHAFWTIPDPALMHTQQAMFAKNLALLGAALMMARSGAGPLSLDEGR